LRLEVVAMVINNNTMLYSPLLAETMFYL